MRIVRLANFVAASSGGLRTALCELGAARRLTGDYAAAAADERQALYLFRRLGDRLGQAWALNELGLAQQMTGDYAAAAANVAEAIDVFRALGSQQCLATGLNDLGEISLRTSAIRQAREHHHEALGIARAFGVPLQEARALEGIGRTFLGQDGAEAAAHLRQALAIYQRIGVPGAQRVLDVLGEHGLR